MFLRYDKVPYQLFCDFQKFMNIEFRNIDKNPYIEKYISEKYKILIALLQIKIRENELENVAEKFRKL